MIVKASQLPDRIHLAVVLSVKELEGFTDKPINIELSQLGIDSQDHVRLMVARRGIRKALREGTFAPMGVAAVYMFSGAQIRVLEKRPGMWNLCTDYNVNGRPLWIHLSSNRNHVDDVLKSGVRAVEKDE